MDKKIKEALQKIENQLYTINAQKISLHWIGLQEMPTKKDIYQLNKELGFIIQEVRELRKTGDMDSEQIYKKVFGETF